MSWLANECSKGKFNPDALVKIVTKVISAHRGTSFGKISEVVSFLESLSVLVGYYKVAIEERSIACSSEF